MPKHFYTLLIIPHKKKDSVKKFLATPIHFRIVSAVSSRSVLFIRLLRL